MREVFFFLWRGTIFPVSYKRNLFSQRGHRRPRRRPSFNIGGDMAATRFLVLLLAFFFQARSEEIAIKKKVLIIGLDGLRPDAMLASHIPNLRALIRQGSFAAYASADSIT